MIKLAAPISHISQYAALRNLKLKTDIDLDAATAMQFSPRALSPGPIQTDRHRTYSLQHISDATHACNHVAFILYACCVLRLPTLVREVRLRANAAVKLP